MDTLYLVIPYYNEEEVLRETKQRPRYSMGEIIL